MASIESPDEARGDSRAPRYLLVEVGGQAVAWELIQVREIVSARNVTRLPGAPVWVLGLLNLRGTVLTVVDLAQRLGLVPAAVSGSVVVVEHEGRTLGVRVDRVHAVATSADATVEPVEAARAADGLVTGMVRLVDGPALLMDAGALCRSVLVTI